MYMSASHMGLAGTLPYGLGQSASQLASSGISVGTAVASIAGFGAIAGPIGAIAGTLIGIFTQVFSGCGQTCVLSSNEANQVQTALQNNLAAWNASQKTQTEQTAALANFDYAWSQLQQVCGNPSMGSAGQRCLSERERGGVSHWCCTAPRCTANSGPYDSCSVPSSSSCNGGPPCCTGCDYFKVYRDPIANDPAVIPDQHALLPPGSTVGGVSTVPASASPSSFAGTVTVGSVQIPMSVLVLAGVGILALAVLS